MKRIYALRYFLTVVALIGAYYLNFQVNAIDIAASYLGLSYTIGESLIVDLTWFVVVTGVLLESLWSMTGKFGIKNEEAPPLIHFSLSWFDWVTVAALLLCVVGGINTFTSELGIVAISLLLVGFIGQRINEKTN